MIDLEELQKRFNELFKNETAESFQKWLDERSSTHPEHSDNTNIETVYRKIVECKKCGDKNYLTDEPEIIHPEEPEGQEELWKEAINEILFYKGSVTGLANKFLLTRKK